MPADVALSAVAFMAAKKLGRAMTPEQFGYYISSEHIDSPAGLTNEDDLLSAPPTIQAPRGAALPNHARGAACDAAAVALLPIISLRNKMRRQLVGESCRSCSP
jgi:hypothetical protein